MRSFALRAPISRLGPPEADPPEAKNPIYEKKNNKTLGKIRVFLMEIDVLKFKKMVHVSI